MIKRETELAPLPAVLLLFIRGAVLWVLVPLSFLVWCVVWPWAGLHARSPRLFISWIDYTFTVALERGPLRPLIPEPRLGWLPANRMDELPARTRPNDLL